MTVKERKQKATAVQLPPLSKLEEHVLAHLMTAIEASRRALARGRLSLQSSLGPSLVLTTIVRLVTRSIRELTLCGSPGYAWGVRESG